MGCPIKHTSVTVSGASLPCAMLHTLQVLSKEAVMAMAFSCPAPTWMSVTGSVCCDLHIGGQQCQTMINSLSFTDGRGSGLAAAQVAGRVSSG